jgi:YesN/AraC family two-component response regulator
MSIQVLLADDHQIVREGLKVLLEREGFDVVAEASNGQQAVQMAEKFHPDVAVLDLAMPLLNGLDAAREIHEDPRSGGFGSGHTGSLPRPNVPEPRGLTNRRAGLPG